LRLSSKRCGIAKEKSEKRDDSAWTLPLRRDCL
jgi:hypothetical protein